MGEWLDGRILRLGRASRLIFATAVTLLYVISSSYMLSPFGDEADDLAALPVGAIGALLGPIPGLVAGLCAFLFTELRRQGPSLDLTIQVLPHLVLFTAIGFVSGRMRDVLKAAREQSAHLARSEDRLEQAAAVDPLTGLPRRSVFDEELGRVGATAITSLSPFAVLLVDIDHLGELNITLGYKAGDDVLRESARRIRRSVRDSDIAARLGGDEFAILLADADLARATRVADRILGAFRAPFTSGSREIGLTVSAGVALFPDHSADPQAVTGRAEIALYRAMRQRNACAVYGLSDEEPSIDDVTMLSDLRRAIELDQIGIAVQPEVVVAEGTLIRVEALARWEHPTHGSVPPGRFVRIAEGAGLIVPLTGVVLGQACRAAARWRAEGRVIGVAVNLSGHDLADPQLARRIGDVLRRHGLPASSLTLEVTETAIIADLDRASALLRDLRAMGVAIAIDDFGTGYSSLTYLDRLPVSEIKIDRSFIARMHEDPGALSIVRAAVSLAHEMGLRVVAEGVEDEAQLATLRAAGCDGAQGFLIGRPMSVDAVAEWLEHRALAGPASRPSLLGPVMDTPGLISARSTTLAGTP